VALASPRSTGQEISFGEKQSRVVGIAQKFGLEVSPAPGVGAPGPAAAEPKSERTRIDVQLATKPTPRDVTRRAVDVRDHQAFVQHVVVANLTLAAHREIAEFRRKPEDAVTVQLR